MYISIDPAPVEARIKELEERIRRRKKLMEINQNHYAGTIMIEIFLIQDHINDLKKIIGK